MLAAARAGPKPGAWNSIQDSQMGDRHPRAWTITCCLPWCVVGGNWDLRQSRDLNQELQMGCGHPKQSLNTQYGTCTVGFLQTDHSTSTQDHRADVKSAFCPIRSVQTLMMLFSKYLLVLLAQWATWQENVKHSCSWLVYVLWVCALGSSQGEGVLSTSPFARTASRLTALASFATVTGLTFQTSPYMPAKTKKNVKTPGRGWCLLCPNSLHPESY